ncbi:MAG: M56 family metallopeptidase [Cyclobacteriaceae bacterium]
MKEFLTYQFEVSMYIFIFYSIYFLLLRNDTGFTLKRIFILFSSISAFLIPLITIEFQSHSKYVEIPKQIITYLPQSIEPAVHVPNESSIWVILFSIWVIGCLLMLFRLLISLIQTLSIVGKAKKSEDGSYLISNEDIQSFSFFKWIVLNKISTDQESLPIVLAHERVHSSQHHSIDILLFEVIKIIQWFNPIVWTYNHHLVRNLEYIADLEVVNIYLDKHKYQTVLIQGASIAYGNTFNVGFSKEQLKNRITMMNQTDKRPSKIKWIFTIPLIFLMTAFTVFAKSGDYNFTKSFEKLIQDYEDGNGFVQNSSSQLIMSQVGYIKSYDLNGDLRLVYFNDTDSGKFVYSYFYFKEKGELAASFYDELTKVRITSFSNSLILKDSRNIIYLSNNFDFRGRDFFKTLPDDFKRSITRKEDGILVSHFGFEGFAIKMSEVDGVNGDIDKTIKERPLNK